MNPEEIRQRLDRIEERNRRVEADKAWETSLLRRSILAVTTYVVALIFMLIAEIEQPFLNAFIPSGAYLFSTWSLPFIKKIWLRNKTGQGSL